MKSVHIPVAFYMLCFTLLPFTGSTQVGFEKFIAYPTGSFAEVVCVGDMNNDGLNDVVLGTSFYFDPDHDYKIFVFIQDPFAGLLSPVIYPYPEIYSGITSLDIADVNNDHRNDVIIGYNNDIGIFFQNSSGTLDPVISFHSGTGVDGVKAADLNNDGKTDIAVSHWNSSLLRVFYQTSSNGFTTIDYPKPNAGYDEIEPGDFNCDGLQDVVFMAGQGVGGIHVFNQGPDGLLGNYRSYFPASIPFKYLNGIGVGDLDNDHRDDIAASMGGNMPDAYMDLWIQDSVTRLMKSPPLVLNAYECPESTEVDDMDCDGKNEIIVAHGGWTRLTVFSQNQAGKYDNYAGFLIPYATHYQPEGLSIGDVNRDGKKDIVLADYNSGLIVLINNTMPSHWDTLKQVIELDTVAYNVYTETTHHFIRYADTSQHYVVTRTDTVEITKTFLDQTILFDTLIIRHSSLCGKDFGDTIRHSSTHNSLEQTGCDTLLIRGRTDTVNIVTEIRVYPNPTDGVFNIDLPAPYDHAEIQYTIFEGSGRLIRKEKTTAHFNRREMDISEMPDGEYLLVINGQDLEVVKKIILYR